MNSLFIQPKILDGNKISYEYLMSRVEVEKAFKGQETRLLKDKSIEIKDGTRAKKEYVEREGIGIIGPGDIRDSIIYINKLRMIKKEGLKEKDFIQESDVLITTAGKSGQVVYVSEGLEDSAITCDIARLRFRNKNDAVSVYHFLKSELGQLQLQALKMGKLNRILLEDIGNIRLPVNMGNIEEHITEDMEIQVKCNKLYKECVNVFENIVQYDYFDDELQNIFYVKSDILETLRLDVEHYTYYQSELFKFIHRETQNIKWNKLGELVHIKRAIKSEIDEQEEVEYFTLKNIDADLSVIHSVESGIYGDLSNRMRYIVEEGEIVTAKVGSATGTDGHVSSVISKRFSGMLTTDAFFNIVPKEIDTYYLLFLLKQPLILKQIDMFTKGTLYKIIQRKDFENIKIPRIDQEMESCISEKMKECIEEYEEILNK
ncbi:hypothetical protein [Clostridium sporogenes]|uniref:Restriction endonuclease subunit S n=1 Tax=Clostridium sporogenes TaxID=1509 RepID=A0A7U4JPA9_CLOSG|nr:hypothetical protein [Clostridium sporogenes]AKC62824.1 hypothetical protein CLSPO_c21040 [Clostridium sporogenes]AKJ90075.1 hypothetical protein CLSPOx_10595 [Clostridium sporogenes]KCZ68202.1 hypothetical protein CSPO_6c02450 [Clostridium sporogenes]KOY64356.1 hypothetical protein AN649_18730 [Clostridium sporogenes]OOO65338.1 hypothetical protein BS099_15745 [Clostridium sporogenes]